MWIDLQAATCLTDKAAELLQAAWEQEWALTAEQRGECAVAMASPAAGIAAAKVITTKVGDITNRIFEVMGARATSGKYCFDRYWRNLRTFTLHDPNDELPEPNFYSSHLLYESLSICQFVI